MPTRKTSPPDDAKVDNPGQKKPRKVSPRNGNPVPNGRLFTSEIAKEAQKKSAEERARRRSIKQSFLAMMDEEMTVVENGKRIKRTGAEVIARSIISGSSKNNAKMTEIALALLDEKPTEKLDLSVAIPKFDNLDEAFRMMHGGDAG